MRYLQSFSLFENVSQAKAILKSLGKDVNDDSYKKIREMLTGHDGYVGWFTKLHYKNGYDLNSLLDLYDIIKTNSAYINRLPKPLISYENIEELQDNIESLRVESSYNRILGEFPNEQSKFLKNTDKELLQNLASRKDYKGFFKKVSSYHNRKDLIAAIKTFLSVDPNASLDRVMKIAKENGSVITHFSYENNILIVRVYDAAQLNKIAGDCSWCIRSQSTFNSYVNKNSKQFVIFLFDRIDNLSRIGVTARLDNQNFYHTAHDKNDRGVSYVRLKEILAEYEVDVDDILKFKLSDFDVNKVSVKRLIDTFKLSKEEIIEIKSVFSANDIAQFTKEEIDKWNLLEKGQVSYDTLSKYSFEEVISKKLIERLDSISIHTILYMYRRYGYRVFDYLKKNIKILNSLEGSVYGNNTSDGEFFRKEILNGELPNDPWYLKIGSTWGSERGDRYSYERSIFKMLWFKDDIKRRYEKGEWSNGRTFSLESLFIDDSTEYTIELLRDIGVKPQDALSVISKNYKWEYYKQLIKWYKEDNIDTSEVISELFDKIKNKELKEWDMRRYKESGYFTDDQIKELETIIINREFSKDIPTSGYSRDMNSSHARTFYEKWNDQLKERYESLTGWYVSEKKLGLILLYAKIGKLDELAKLNLKLSSYSGQKVVKELTEMITGTYNTNGGMNENLTEDECKKIYNFMTTQCDIKDLSLGRYSVESIPTEDSKESGVVEARERDNRYYYLPAMYLYDRNEFDSYLMYEVSNVKYNRKKDKVFIPERGNKEKNITDRIEEIRPIFKFLFYSTKTDSSDIDDLIGTLLSFDLSLTEIKSLIETVSYARNYYSRREGKKDIDPATKKLLINYLNSKTNSEAVRKKFYSLI